jgi:tRNA-Thr(GGU) m(6)t(6)A37 methyltransferase TsaA
MTAAPEPIGHVETSYRDPSSVPSQASESEVTARVVVDERFVDGLLGLDRYPYLWLLTWLHDQPEERPLRLVPRATEATGEVQGVFASRAPGRPNPIGLSLVRQLGIEGRVVTVAGVDLLDGTPVLDIKPWFADCDLPPAHRPDAS